MSQPLKAALFVAEPPPKYLIMPPVVIDCSLIAGLIFAEPNEDLAGQAIEGKSLNAPYLLSTEMSSVALKKLNDHDSSWVFSSLSQFLELPIAFHPIDPIGTLELAKKYKLSAYDAAYLWLAAHLKTPLLTFDQRLGKAAQEHLSGLE